MVKNRMYYLLLGLGLGIVFTSSLNIVFNKPKKVEYSEQEIIQKARELGMVPVKEKIELNTDNKKGKSEKNKNTKGHSKAEGQYRIVKIDVNDVASDISLKLKKTGIIKDENDFLDFIIKKDLQRKFITGEYKLKVNESYEELIKTMTSQP